MSVAILIPAALAAVWMSLSAPTRCYRVVWFLIAFLTAQWLPLCRWWENSFIDVTARSHPWLDRIFTLTGVAGTGAELPIVVAFTSIPWLVVCLCLLNAPRWMPKQNAEPLSRTWPQFTLRELVGVTVLLCVAATWLSSNYRRTMNRTREAKEVFLAEFCDSFSDSQITNPFITDETIFSGFTPSEFHMYRVVGEFEKGGISRWGAWDYAVMNGQITNFASFDAPSEGKFPPFGTSFERVSKPVGPFVDGEPGQTWPVVAIRNVSCEAGAIEITVDASPGTYLDLDVSPFTATAGPPPTMVPVPQSGKLIVSFPLASTFKGKQVTCEVLCRENTLYRPARDSCLVDCERPTYE